MDSYICGKHIVHTLKCPLTAMVEVCWQQVCSGEAVLTVLADAHRSTNLHTYTHSKAEEKNLWKINKLRYRVRAGDGKLVSQGSRLHCSKLTLGDNCNNMQMLFR